jgi:hypothetical protein
MLTIARRTASGFHSLLSSVVARFSGRAPQAARQHPKSSDGKTRDARVELARPSRKTGMAMQTLKSTLKAGKITQEEYAARVAHLSENHPG